MIMLLLLLLVPVVEFCDSQTHIFPEVDPSRQQFFERESLTISCEGLNGQTGWRVMKKRKGDIQTCASTWETSTGPCKIINAYQATESGKYWCEMGEEERSKSVNITITDAPVILESPVAPVKEGDNVTLYCRKRDKDSSFTAQFYKNGVVIGSGSAGNTMTLTVSRSFEGFYKCSISEEEESPESWLTVQMMIMLLLLLLVPVVEFCDSQTHIFPQVDPSRQQFFERESLTISCEGLNGQTGWRVMKKRKGDIQTCASTWETSTGPCKIINAYQATDSGKYWCEMGEEERSKSVNITVTDAPVILESPVAPVKEGDNVTLYCRKSDKDSSFTAQFYKNGVVIGSGSAGNMMTLTVSRSFEGFYKCSISEEEESPESWLTVQSKTYQYFKMN
ncbi:high affinity immunoglobulin gamma Fc receptor I-like [Archocentrus centrarchus]|uniref:high affinity immunoglobulin gamma Fc receptor I-like n=1 Tax=Archocentrus centrarchus TaxID=63155 RepID=UPI0011E9DC11|nr:high affinity immunoglobulin gamma Fc receptor I-like [Archocentrus centrarchus]